ncbi:MAG TPA: response regulator transcription factor [Rhodocyclaceae bacterium]|nr:response regulator transcription factor [Rhodocyclaceae bacterium]
MKPRVVLADDHLMFRQALRIMLEHQGGVDVVAEASDGAELLQIARKVEFDIVCMDIGMPHMNGTEATRQLLALHPKVKVIGLSAFADREFILDLLKAGASGYVTKTDASDELLRAIQAVRLNRKYLCSDIAEAVTGALVKDPAGHSAAIRLGPRERQVLQLVAEGYTSVQIAEKLHIAPSTSEVHRRNIMRKLDLHSVAELTKYAIRNGLTTH